MSRGTAFKEAVRSAFLDAHPKERYSDKALGVRAGVSENTIRRMWSGEIPSLSTLVAVANAVDISVVDALMAVQGRSVSPSGDAMKRIADALDRIAPPVAPAQDPTRPPEQRAPRASRAAARMARGSTPRGAADGTER